MNTLKILGRRSDFRGYHDFRIRDWRADFSSRDSGFGADGRSQRRASADPGERCRGCTAHGTALRSGRILQPSRISVFGRPACEDKL